MPPKKDLCRNFQRGSCQYGDRCKFIHATAQQPKTNPFGFGSQSGSPFQQTNQQQQMPNPFGFGVQNNTQSRGGNDFGSKPNQFKPFENKWTRFSPLNNTSSSPASRQQPENQQQTANHTCTDSESCKRIIVEDLENEKPLWKLTCYAHNKNAPCDVAGDISCEELRALAYDDSKQGRNLQFIIERERNLLNSMLVEFQNLVQKPYTTVSSFSTPSIQTPFSTPIMNSGFSSPASSFSQLGPSLSTRSDALPNYTFGQSSTGAQNNNSHMFQMNNSPFNTAGAGTGSGAFVSKPMQPSIQTSFLSGSTSSSNSAINAQSNPFNNAQSNPFINAQSNPFATLASSAQTGNAFDKQSNFVSNGLDSTSSRFGQSSISFPLIDSTEKEKSNVDDSIWKKAEWKWNVGEIPEDAPPDIFIH